LEMAIAEVFAADRIVEKFVVGGPPKGIVDDVGCPWQDGVAWR